LFYMFINYQRETTSITTVNSLSLRLLPFDHEIAKNTDNLHLLTYMYTDLENAM